MLKLKFSYFLVTILTLTAFGTIWSQTRISPGTKGNNKRKITVEKPDLENIREETLNPKSQYYFPKLMEKYLKNDTVMTHDEYRHFYLGYMFQEDYDPYRESHYAEITDNLIQTGAPFDSIRKYAEKSLLDNPFDLPRMSFLVHALKEKKKWMSAKIWEYRLEHILAAIKSTGTGEDIDNAWFVIYPSHEYDLVRLLGYEATDVDFVEPAYDHLIVRPENNNNKRLNAKGFYFNVEIPTEQYILKHPESVEVQVEE